MSAPNTTLRLLSTVTIMLCISILFPLQVIAFPIAHSAQLVHLAMEENKALSMRRLHSVAEQDARSIQVSRTPSFPGHPHNRQDDGGSDILASSALADDVIKNYRPQRDHKPPIFAKLKSPLHKINKVKTSAESKQAVGSNMQVSKAEQDDSRVPRMSIFSVIHPVLAAALAPDKHTVPKLPLKGPISRVEYKSSPLRGTEARDREALGLPTDSVPLSLVSSQQSLNSQQLPHIFNGNQRRAGELPSAPSHHSFMEDEEDPHHNYRTSPSKFPAASLSPTVSDQNEFASYERVRHFETDISPQWEYAKPSRSMSISQQVSALQNSSKKFWSSVIDNIRQTIEKLRASTGTGPQPLQKAEKLSKTQNEKRKEGGYTEEDLDMMINDIMREIQMRSEDAQAYRKMLKENNRWSASEDVGSGPLIFKSKLLVDPKTVADALTHSTKKLVLTKFPQPSREATIELLRALQVKLAELLQTTG